MSPLYSQFERLTSWGILRAEGICKLPVDPLDIMKNHHIDVVSYAKIKEKKYFPEEYLPYTYGTDAFCYCNSGRYYVAVNPDMDIKKWRHVVMHEVCHILLGHINSLVPHLELQQDDKQEKDAEQLAADILCPSVVLHLCGCSSAEQLSDICRVDMRLATKHYVRLQLRRINNDFLTSPFERDMAADFLDFICEYWRQNAVDSPVV